MRHASCIQVAGMTTRANWVEVAWLVVAAVAMAAVLLSLVAVASGAQIIRGIVVRGVALDRVALVHEMPPYPLEARNQGMEGEVRVRVELRDGKVLALSAESRSLTLPDNSSRWIREHWRWRRVSGVYYVPISYKLA